MTSFRSETYQNEYLPAGGVEVHAAVTVTASRSLGDAGSGPSLSAAAEIIIVDTSGSMSYPRATIRAAREATAAAIDCIRDGVRFGVLAGTENARQVYPGLGQLVEASDATRADAKDAVAKLSARGGTAMGKWLERANELFLSEPGSIRHAILLTDGENANETPEELDLVLSRCEGNFQCDCRGVGAGWQPSELREIAAKLLGEVEVIREPQMMAADFTALMERAMGKQVSDVALRLWTPQGATVAFVKQVIPEVADLTGRRAAFSELEGDYPTGAWGNESRDYHLCIRVPARDVGDEMLAGRVKLVVNGEVVSETKILAVWTDDEGLSKRTEPKVVEHKLRGEYVEVAAEAVEARDAGDEEKATAKFTRLHEIAEALSDQEKLDLIGRVADVDRDTGRTTPKRNVDKLDDLEFETRSVKTKRTRIPGS